MEEIETTTNPTENESSHEENNDEALISLEDNDKKNDDDDDDNDDEEEDDEEEDEESEDSQLKCFLCKQFSNQPKFLCCTHSFCVQCCEKLLSNRDEIQCPICHQSTRVSNVNELIDNYLLNSQIEDYSIRTGRIECRACTSNEKGVAYCSTCSSYLCGKCVQAHQYMKCFEQHQVRSLTQTDSQDENQIERTEIESIRKQFNEKFQSIDEIRSNALTNLDQQLNCLQTEYDQTKTQIDLIHIQYQQALNQVYKDCLTRLDQLQHDEELTLMDKLEKVQKTSQLFDDSRSIVDKSLTKCSFKQINELKQKLFDEQFNSYERFFHLYQLDDQHAKNSSVQFVNPPIDEFQQILKIHFGQLIKPDESKQQDHHPTTTDSVSSSSGIGSLPIGSMSNHERILSNGDSPSNVNHDELFHPNHVEPVEENLRALESFFVGSLNNNVNVNSNVQRNLEEIFQMKQQQNLIDQPYSMLSRQVSAPPLTVTDQQRSPSNVSFPPPSLLATYSSTNSGGSSNGNNSRSTTPFSGLTQGSSLLDINLNCQSSMIRRTGQSMQVRAKFGSLGPQKCQFNAPHGFCLGIDEEIIVADTNNHRIQIFDKNGEYKYQFGMPGKEEGQLWYPRKVAVIRQTGKFVICDRGNERSRMQIFTRNGHFIRKISIRYIDIVAGLAISQQGNIVAVDSVSPTVFCISENGDLIKWFDCSDYMREPSDIAIFNNEYFVCDFKGHCVVVFDEDGNYLRRIGSESITNFPNGIDISDAGSFFSFLFSFLFHKSLLF